MKRYQQLIKDTWWLWLIFAIAAFVMITFVNIIFVIMVPILIAVFLYFALVRYDDDGNFIGS